MAAGLGDLLKRLFQMTAEKRLQWRPSAQASYQTCQGGYTLSIGGKPAPPALDAYLNRVIGYMTIPLGSVGPLKLDGKEYT
ncbi:MAG: hypothetical protein K2W96_18950, partial [Gemmataceae bacterium]|nr:hypothetical protein [Gemmataceae bacterium]